MTEVPSLDVAAPGFFADPYPQYAELRANDPVHRHPAGPWSVFRHDDALDVLRSDDLSIRDVHAVDTARNQMLSSVIGDGFLHKPTMTRADPPDHTRFRRVLTRHFTPRAVEAIRADVDATVAELFEAARGGDQLDLVGQIARPLAYRVTAQLIGAPAGGDEDTLMRSSHAATVALMEPFPTRGQVEAAAPAMATLYEVADDVVRWKRTQPTDDTAVSALLAAESAGTITPRETITLVSMLFTAGHQTTYSAVALTVLALLRNRAQWELLCEQPALLRDAVEECLRYDNTIQVGWRTTPDERVVGGTTVPAGVHVLVWNGSANRDAEHWGPTADELDIRRPDASAHLSFGSGPHLCIGAWLARIEIQSVLGHLVEHHPHVELAADPEWRRLVSLRGPEHLDLALHGT